jgi:hypothetical protein
MHLFSMHPEVLTPPPTRNANQASGKQPRLTAKKIWVHESLSRMNDATFELETTSRCPGSATMFWFQDDIAFMICNLQP